MSTRVPTKPAASSRYVSLLLVVGVIALSACGRDADGSGAATQTPTGDGGSIPTTSPSDGGGASTDGGREDAAPSDGGPLSDGGVRDGGSGDGSARVVPTLFGHAMAYNPFNGPATTVVTPAMTTPALGSTVVASIGRGNLASSAAPTDNKGNTFAQVGSNHAYTQWPSSGTAVYAIASAAGGAGHVLTTVVTPAGDEVTLAAVDVANGGKISDAQWTEALKGTPLTSKSVTTAGPATLVAFWWGDGDVGFAHTAVPNNGFQILDSVLVSGALVQVAVAAKDVAAAGTYDVTWDSAGKEGAQLWLVAVEKAP